MPRPRRIGSDLLFESTTASVLFRLPLLFLPSGLALTTAFFRESTRGATHLPDESQDASTVSTVLRPRTGGGRARWDAWTLPEGTSRASLPRSPQKPPGEAFPSAPPGTFSALPRNFPRGGCNISVTDAQAQPSPCGFPSRSCVRACACVYAHTHTHTTPPRPRHRPRSFGSPPFGTAVICPSDNA